MAVADGAWVVGTHALLVVSIQADNFTLVMESDIGAFKPTGLSFTGR